MPKCHYCGADVSATAKLCSECGQDQWVSVPQDQRLQTEDVPVPAPPSDSSSGGGWGGWRAVIAVIVLLLVLVVFFRPGENSESSGEQALGQTFTKENYGELVADPQGNRGAQVDITGKVLTDPEVSGNRAFMQIFADPKNSEWHTVVRAHADSADINRDDYVRVKGSVGGQFEGENAFGAKRQAVEVQADSVDSVDPAEALDPAQSILQVGQTRENQGFSATIDRIEFGEETTRVNVTARNNSGYKVSFFTHNAKIVQGSKQVDPDRYSLRFDIPEPQSDLNPSVETEGVVVFGPVDPSGPFTIELNWSSRGRDVRAQPLVFEISPP